MKCSSPWVNDCCGPTPDDRCQDLEWLTRSSSVVETSDPEANIGVQYEWTGEDGENCARTEVVLHPPVGCCRALIPSCMKCSNPWINDCCGPTPDDRCQDLEWLTRSSSVVETSDPEANIGVQYEWTGEDG